MPYVGKKPADIIATAVDTTTGTFSGEIDAASLDISGNIDVDGTTNLDVVDIDGALTQDGGAVFNEGSADVDFRVESNGNANMLFVDGGNDSVLMGGTETVVYADTSGNQLEYGSYFALKRETANSSQAVAYFNNTGSDGNIIDLRKDGSTVGSIGVNSNYMVIGSPVGGAAHLLIGNSLIHPATSTGATKDNAIDIGGSSNRFKDLYLSGGVVFGSTGGAVTGKTLDDYEEGTFTPTLALSNATLTSSGGTGRYTKIGRWVYIEGSVTRATASGASSGVVQIESLPFTSLNANSINVMGSGTIWMDEGGPSTNQGDTVGHAYVPSNTARAEIVRGTSSGAQTSARYGIGSEMSNGRPLYFNFAYTTA